MLQDAVITHNRATQCRGGFAVMRLTQVRIQLFRNFVDSQEIRVEPDVTALVGKNESGKTTILHALHRLHPANLKHMRFNLVQEYPRWRLSDDRKAAGSEDALKAGTLPVEAWFELDSDDTAALVEVLGVTAPVGTTCFLACTYANTRVMSLAAPANAVITAAAKDADIDTADRKVLATSETVDVAKAAARDMAKEAKEAGETARAKVLGAFSTAVSKYGPVMGDEMTEEQGAAVLARVPRFFYFSDYDLLPGEHDLSVLADKLGGGRELTSEEESVNALLSYANTTPSDFLGDEYDARKAELQASALSLSRKVFAYWKQNTDLEVEFDAVLEQVDEDDDGDPLYHRVLKVLMKDARHGGVSTNFETRSHGFRWFFSFLAAFSQYLDTPDPIVVLLDEPGTSLHGEAQKDFLRFIHEQLGRSKQVLYTTHSQHMVDPAQYEKLRGVEDRSTKEHPELGVVVTAVDVSADPDTLLPIQGALGYSISQHLLLGAGRHLVVEGGSDFLYLQHMSEHLGSLGRTKLDHRLAIVPLGSASNAPAFVALFSRHMKVSVLLDGDQNGKDVARVYGQAGKGLIDRREVVVIGDVPGLPTTKPDIEDLFDEADYLRLYNWAFDRARTVAQLPAPTDRIIARIETLDPVYDHAGPAYALTNHRDEFFAAVQAPTLDRFEGLIKLLNATVGPNG